MTHAAKKLLDEYEALPGAERHEVLAELLRRAAAEPHDVPDDADLIAAADHIFLEMDRRERPE